VDGGARGRSGLFKAATCVMYVADRRCFFCTLTSFVEAIQGGDDFYDAASHPPAACNSRREALLLSNRNRLLASLIPDELSLLSKHLREVAIEQGELLEERGEPAELVHFPQSGMVSLIVELPEDRAIEVGTVGSEGAIGLTVGLGSRIGSVSALVQVSGASLCIPAQRFRALASQNQDLTTYRYSHSRGVGGSSIRAHY
jgi:hypothetical protein